MNLLFAIIQKTAFRGTLRKDGASVIFALRRVVLLRSDIRLTPSDLAVGSFGVNKISLSFKIGKRVLGSSNKWGLPCSFPACCGIRQVKNRFKIYFTLQNLFYFFELLSG